VTLQPQYSLLVREIESEIVPACLDAAWACCRGRHRRRLAYGRMRGTPPRGATRLGEDPDRGMEAWEPRTARAHVARHRHGLRDRHGARRQPTQVSLAWLEGRPAVRR
jgi:aryl-alcohol dehydrogenase (NADP+)